MSFLRNIQFKPLSWGKRRKTVMIPGEHEPAAQSVPTLKHILPVTVRRTETGQFFQLLGSHLNPKEIQFRTDMLLQEWEVLEVEVLLQGIGYLRMMGQVRRFNLHRVSENEVTGAGYVKCLTSYSGVLEIWPTPMQEQNINDFLWRQTCRERV